MPKQVLLCSLGVSWAVIPEAIALMAPERVPLFAHHPRRDRLEQARREYSLGEPDEVWVITTDDPSTGASRGQLNKWNSSLERPFALRIIAAAGTGDVGDEEKCRIFRELALRSALHAAFASGHDLVVSLAGGRKTMSSDMQRAAQLFGCRALLHVVESQAPKYLLRDLSPDTLLRPIPAEDAHTITPLVVGSFPRSELVDLLWSGDEEEGLRRFPLGPACTESMWEPDERWLDEELRHFEREGARSFVNLAKAGTGDETFELWPALYRLPPRTVKRLRLEVVGADASELRWLTALPKADLHRHLGGVLDLDGMTAIGQAVWSACSAEERDDAKQASAFLPREGPWPHDWSLQLRGDGRSHERRAARTAYVLLHHSPETLERELWSTTAPRVGLKSSRLGFRAYELPGELSGSAILGHRAAIRPYVEHAARLAREEGVRYVEWRGSPDKYGWVARTELLEEFRRALEAVETDDFVARFVWILDRRDPVRAESTVEAAVQSRDGGFSQLVGFDLAGDEGQRDVEAFGAALRPAYERCLKVTIHAGEGEDASSIWTAAYVLHADRIGHGLSLAEKPELATRFRDRGVCLELCPTSNVEVVGFRDPERPETETLPKYPLRRLMGLGLPLTLCTDNPAISRTSLPKEYIVASRLCGGLTRWEALALSGRAFRHAFCDEGTRRSVAGKAGAELLQQLASG